jgi:hypothetical protein
MELPVPPVLQLYVEAPEAVSVELPPEHIVAGDAVAVTVGGTFTVTVTVAVFVHPFASVPVTVYVVVEAGVTVMELPVPPVLQLYVEAPDAVSVELPPEHIVAGDAVAVTVGGAFTVTVTVAVFVHPFASVPVTVYVAVDVGVTLMELVFCPLLQLYVEAPEAVSVELPPEHIVAGDAVAVTLGKA